MRNHVLKAVDARKNRREGGGNDGTAASGLSLFFLKIGAFSFGGGYAVLAFIQREVVDGHGWIDPADFVNIVAIAEMTPGLLR